MICSSEQLGNQEETGLTRSFKIASEEINRITSVLKDYVFVINFQSDSGTINVKIVSNLPSKKVVSRTHSFKKRESACSDYMCQTIRIIKLKRNSSWALWRWSEMQNLGGAGRRIKASPGHVMLHLKLIVITTTKNSV